MSHFEVSRTVNEGCERRPSSPRSSSDTSVPVPGAGLPQPWGQWALLFCRLAVAALRRSRAVCACVHTCVCMYALCVCVRTVCACACVCVRTVCVCMCASSLVFIIVSLHLTCCQLVRGCSHDCQNAGMRPELSVLLALQPGVL